MLPIRRRTLSPCMTVMSRTSYGLNVPNVYRVSINPSGSAALAFVQDSNVVYSVYKLQTNQQAPANAVDCEPQNLPVYCVLPVPGNFDRPTKAIFSADGTTAFVLNCGPECGGQASVSFLPVAGIIIQSGAPIPPGAPTAVTATVPIPGGTRTPSQNANLFTWPGSSCNPMAFRRVPLDPRYQHQAGHGRLLHRRWDPPEDGVRRRQYALGRVASSAPRANAIIRARPATSAASPCSTLRTIRYR